ncbi:hypothetical protein K0M31_001555 [Melipona bicolor]|uniref:Uncharacterized protein n=1 Tax=Melipona bicolor TaxID=60889 RepID=A0AA40KY93_9HYME|nr:hypothetical protein K0M31_001555 [Melipona bicolor]
MPGFRDSPSADLRRRRIERYWKEASYLLEVEVTFSGRHRCLLLPEDGTGAPVVHHALWNTEQKQRNAIGPKTIVAIYDIVSSGLRRSTSPSHNPQGFLAAASDRGACVTSANSKLPAMKAAFESPDIPGYVYLLEHSRASDGGGSKVDRRGIETYLLAQLAAPVHQLPLSIRGNFGYPPPPQPLRVRAQLPCEIRISQICFRRCTLNSRCFREMINRTASKTVEAEAVTALSLWITPPASASSWGFVGPHRGRRPEITMASTPD